MDDIVPGLLESIQTQFDERTYASQKLKSALQALESKTATYRDANEFAIEIGDILSEVLSSNITVDILPGGKMHFNIADRLLNATLKKNHDLISAFTIRVQNLLNQKAGLRLKGQTAELNQDRIDGMVNRISSEDDFENIKWILDEPIVNFCQSIVDDSIQKNAEFQTKAGLAPKLIRSVSGHACDWCKNLAGTYEFISAPTDIYRRHDRCRCIVEYKPSDGRRQDVWSKDWRDPEREKKIEQRKQFNLRKRG